MPEVEDIVDIPAGYATFQGRRDLHIKIPGKYKAEISLPAKTDKVVSHTWNPIRHILTVTLQMVPMQKLDEPFVNHRRAAWERQRADWVAADRT